ncbi:beta-phosphoglucomutase [Sphingomonas oleivorans]|uniref:Beta-phosphoglucomutase n=1 Tax=Sphingomonas oleivorans TaxID=1735121 RepID=A0A2T5G0S0_9SPHN|nr:beta-phosphoglucomutase [Sphingomonas oleivorans]PTQ12733.1 beta-phosphoglucomutase [Sphingomonas oleivorans]
MTLFRRTSRMHDWTIRRTGACNALLATQFALSNGALGVRGNVEERPDGTAICFMARVFDLAPISYHEGFTGFASASETRVPVPDGTPVRITVGDVDLAHLSPLSEEWQLDLGGGTVSRTSIYELPDGRTVEVAAQRFITARDEARLSIALKLSISAGEAPISLRSYIDTDVETVSVDDDPRIGTSGGVRMRTLHRSANHVRAKTARLGLVVDVRQTHDFAEDILTAHPDGVSLSLHGQISAAMPIELKKTVEWMIHETDAPPHGNEPVPPSLGDFVADQLIHEAAMTALWDSAEVALPGNPRLEAALRFNLFHLMQNAPRDGLSGYAAKGLTGEGYEGHVFWDAETFLIPVLALVAPHLARNHLAWRIATLPAARHHARELNHPAGALFAWRTIAGREGSAYFPSGSAQYHINGAVAFALEYYEHSTGDRSLREAGAAETVFETARIWIAAGRYDRNGIFSIAAVTGPDEYSALVDNDYYTDRMAARHLRYAARLFAEMGAEAPEFLAALAERIGLDADEISGWRHAADAFATHDDTAVTPQDATFLAKPEWNFLAEPIGHKPLLLSYHPLTLYRHQVLKQAAVVLAHVLDGTDVPLARKARDYAYYEPRTVHDSTLSPSTHAILAAEIGLLDDALLHFEETARVDLDNLHGNTTHGAHMAAMAGSWLALVWGFAGFRPGTDERPARFAPVLPSGWEGYSFTMLWRGVRIEVSVSGDSCTFTVPEGASLPLLIDGDLVTVTGDASLVRPIAPRPPVLPASEPGHFRAAIFDLDGVLTDSAEEHFLAWQRLAAELGISIDRAFNERLKGVDRMGSLDLILRHGGLDPDLAERQRLAARKNGYYREAIEAYGPHRLLPGARRALVAARQLGLKVGLASSSRNARFLIERLGIASLFDAVVDGSDVARGKPAPDIFLAAAKALGVEPDEAVGIEDAAAGIAAIRAAGMRAIGIGDPTDLPDADIIISTIARLRLERYLPA